MSNKITKKAMFYGLLDTITDDFEMVVHTPDGDTNVTPETIRTFIQHEIELLERKNASERKPTADQMKNNVIKEAIVAGMEANRLYSATELIKEIPECNDLSNQKVSSMLKSLIDEGLVVKVIEKRKSLFRLA